jgi:hypothetical protein
MIRASAVWTIVALLGFLALVTSARAELTPYATYTIPGLSGSIHTFDLADVDGDGSAEVLASDGDDIVLYSPVSDSTYFDINLDSIVTSMNTTYCLEEIVDVRLLLADVNRDSLVDAAILIGLPCAPFNPYNSMTSYRYLIAFVDDVTSGNQLSAALEMEFESAQGIGLLDAIDVDGDGYNNLILSVDSSEYSEIGVSIQWDVSYGKTLVYHSFPDSAMSHFQAVVTSVWPVTASGGSPALLATSRDWLWQDYTGIGPQTITTDEIALLRPDGTVLSSRERQDFSVCSDNGLGASWSNLLEPCWVGDIITATPETEVLCTFLDWENSHDCDTSTLALVAYEITETDSLRELWSVDMGDMGMAHFVADPSFPDQFFAFSGSELLRLDATNGAIIRRYDLLPTGGKVWRYPYGGNVPYLVVISGLTISYYTFDDVTDVETGTPVVLPTTFTLGEPYPNPFNPTVTVPLTIDQKGHLRVEIFNPLGQRVTVLHDAVVSAGETVLSWDASSFGSGVYLIKATLGDETKTVKAVLVK